VPSLDKLPGVKTNGMELVQRLLDKDVFAKVAPKGSLTEEFFAGYAFGVKEGDLEEVQELFQRIDIRRTGRLFHEDIVQFGTRLSNRNEPFHKQPAMAAAAEPSGMTAEARCLLEELFKLVDKDSSGKISESDFAVASRIIEQYRSESLGLTFAEFGETSDGEVNLNEWTKRMGTALRPLGPERCVEVCFWNLSEFRKRFGESEDSRLHPWIDIDFSSLGKERIVIDGAHRRGILLRQLRKLMSFIDSHAGADANLVGWWDRSRHARGRPLNVCTCFFC
jgi:Ca2+-binding EF-hand superfamily protein